MLDQNNLYANGGGAWIPDDNVYIAGAYSSSPMAPAIDDPAIIVYNPDTWEILDFKECDPSAMAWDMCYNPADGKIYGSFPYDAEFNGVFFGTLDYKTGKSTPINSLKVPYVALAAAWSGDMYGIEQTSGDLYHITQDGERTLIGNTGLNPIFFQSATFDYESGNLYWMACQAESSGLYLVDTETAELTLIADYPQLDEWVGIYTRTEYIPSGAPQGVENVELIFTGSETKGTINFTMPSLCYDGTPLSQVSYNVYIADELWKRSEAVPGEKISIDADAPEGMVKFMIEAVNEEGHGPKTVINRWIGFDTPTPVSDLHVTGDANSRTITWNPVTEGIHHGSIDIANLHYKVVRLPDNVTVASDITTISVTDTDLLRKLSPYRYVVTAVVGDLESDKEISNILVLGDPIVAPYNSDFDNIENLLMYVAEDGNKDGNMWTPYYNIDHYVFRYRYSEVGNYGDDWLFSPPVSLEKGQVYGFRVDAANVDYPEGLEVKVGRNCNAESMIFSVIEPFEVTDEDYRYTYFRPEEDGVYYFGFHAISEPYNFYLFLEGWSLDSPVSVSSPSVPKSLELTAGPKGEQFTEIKFNVPEADCNGNPITFINSVTVCNTASGQIVAVIDNPTSGEELAINDNEPLDGMNAYEVYATNEAGRGLSAFGEVWVGMDVPGGMRNFDWQLLSDGSAEIFWDKADSVGKHGGYVDTEEVTYGVIAYYPDVDIISAEKETSLIYSPICEITTPQKMIYFIGYVRNSKGFGDRVRSHVGPVGVPYELPYNESFSEGVPQYGPWAIEMESIDAPWKVTDFIRLSGMISQDGDEGFLVSGGYGNAVGSLISPLVSLKNTDEPVLTFFASRPDASTQLTVKVSSDNGLTWDNLGDIDITEGIEWVRYEFSLADYIDSNICLAFYSNVPVNALECAIDNILITDGGSGIEKIESNANLRMHVKVCGGILQIDNIYDKVNIYSMDGCLVTTVMVEGSASVSLAHGMYLICHNDSYIKVVI